MPANALPTPGPSTPGRKNKIMSAVKRSFPQRSQRPTKGNDVGESKHSYFHFEERAGRVPTVEQISMGLHLSRTPHLRSTNGRSRSMSSEIPTKPDAKPTHRSRATVPIPKSALKKFSSLQTTPTSTTPSFTNVSTSTSTTLSSAILHADRPNSFFTPRLFSRMTKMIPSSQARPPQEAEPDPEISSQKKLVRFSVGEAE